MPFKSVIYEVDDRLFQAEPPPGSRRENAAPAKPSASEELEAWRARAEETARKYQELLQSYRQTKAALKNEAEWRHRCQKLLHNGLRNCQDLELAIVAAPKMHEESGQPGDDDPISAALTGGIRQVIENQLQQLAAEGLLQAVEPQPGELFDDNFHEVVGSKPCGNLAQGLVAEVVRTGYACGPKVVRKARVMLAG
ncbi:MAG TPA: nucleotide exchange factor GrpE [Planctomycetota bacterium]|nr:nucleotide exchange factor GrpE [Planctomycetota bacterium]